MDCPVTAALDMLNANQTAVFEMVIGDREGYDDQLVARFLNDAAGTVTTTADVATYRKDSL